MLSGLTVEMTPTTSSAEKNVENVQIGSNNKKTSAAISVNELKSLCNQTVSSSGSNVVNDIKNMKKNNQNNFASILSQTKAIQEKLDQEKFLWTQKCYAEEQDYKKRRLELDEQKANSEKYLLMYQASTAADLQRELFCRTEIKETRMELLKLGKTPTEIKDILLEMFGKIY
jgi:hypothetical protein